MAILDAVNPIRKRRIILKTKDGPTQILGICPTLEPPVEIVTVDKKKQKSVCILTRVSPLAAYYEELDVEATQADIPKDVPVMPYID